MMIGASSFRKYVMRPSARERYKAWLLSEEGRAFAARERAYQEARKAEARAREESQRREKERLERECAARARNRDFIMNLSPQGFEAHVQRVFRALGYAVKATRQSCDAGVDAFVEKDGKKYIVQCKHFIKGNVSRPDMQQFYGVLIHERVQGGFFVTTASFTEPAIAFSENKPIELIDGERLIELGKEAFHKLYPEDQENVG